MSYNFSLEKFQRSYWIQFVSSGMVHETKKDVGNQHVLFKNSLFEIVNNRRKQVENDGKEII